MLFLTSLPDGKYSGASARRLEVSRSQLCRRGFGSLDNYLVNEDVCVRACTGMPRRKLSVIVCLDPHEARLRSAGGSDEIFVDGISIGVRDFVVDGEDWKKMLAVCRERKLDACRHKDPRA